jgi:hypothetical protein
VLEKLVAHSFVKVSPFNQTRKVCHRDLRVCNTTSITIPANPNTIWERKSANQQTVNIPAYDHHTSLYRSLALM